MHFDLIITIIAFIISIYVLYTILKSDQEYKNIIALGFSFIILSLITNLNILLVLTIILIIIEILYLYFVNILLDKILIININIGVVAFGLSFIFSLDKISINDHYIKIIILYISILGLLYVSSLFRKISNEN